ESDRKGPRTVSGESEFAVSIRYGDIFGFRQRHICADDLDCRESMVLRWVGWCRIPHLPGDSAYMLLRDQIFDFIDLRSLLKGDCVDPRIDSKWRSSWNLRQCKFDRPRKFANLGRWVYPHLKP